MGLLRNRNKDPSCTAHHWVEQRTHKDYRVRGDKSYGASYSVYQRTTFECEHDGCDAEKDEWERINHVPEGVDSGCNRRFREKLNAVLEYP